MTNLRRIASLDRFRRRLVVEATMWLALSWTGLRLLRFLKLQRALHRLAGSPTTAVLERTREIESVRWAVAAVARRLPSTTCLVQALAADAMLRRRGVRSDVRFGVRVAGSDDEAIEAHAWVDCGDGVAIGASPTTTGFDTFEAARSPMESLAALLRGEPVPFRAFGLSIAQFVTACDEEGVVALVDERLLAQPNDEEWPPDVRDALSRKVRADAATELLREREIVSVLVALAEDEVFPIVLKGAALAYSVYSHPSSRPRVDTDLWIARDQLDGFRRTMSRIGYAAPLHCDGELLFCQFPLEKMLHVGGVHRIDCHWKISTQPVFADVLTFDDSVSRAIALPALGEHSRTLAPTDALLLACIHPAMHHRNAQPLVWLYDTHLLASTCSAGQFESFADLAVARRVAAVCAHQLQAARRTLGTRVPESVMRRLTIVEAREASAVYLQPNRRWIDELVSSVRGLPRWRERVRLLREIAFPRPAYMLQAYGVARSASGITLLPFLYLHRLLVGGWKAIAGQK